MSDTGKVTYFNENGTCGGIQGKISQEEYLRHNQELRKIRKFIRNKGASNVFEKNYLASVEQFLERAQYAVKLLDETDYDDLRKGHGGKDRYVMENIISIIF